MADLRAELLAVLDAEEATARAALDEWSNWTETFLVARKEGQTPATEAPKALRLHEEAHRPAAMLRRVAAVRIVAGPHLDIAFNTRTQEQFCAGCRRTDIVGIYLTPADECPVLVALHEGWCAE